MNIRGKNIVLTGANGGIGRAIAKEIARQGTRLILVADEVMRIINDRAISDKYIGWPEKLFVRVNALLPGIVDNTLRKRLPLIRRFAKGKT